MSNTIFDSKTSFNLFTSDTSIMIEGDHPSQRAVVMTFSDKKDFKTELYNYFSGTASLIEKARKEMREKYPSLLK